MTTTPSAAPTSEKSAGSDVSFRHVWATWWPLATSWILMALELPLVSAVVARQVNPEINLAAYGGLVFPLSMLIEAPIIMLLAASTALSTDRPSYRLLRTFMMRTGAILTAIHALVAFTPLYDLIVGRIIGAPAEIHEAGRIGMRIMTPWTWAIAYRRFQQGLLIRYGRSRGIGIGTLVRLVANAAVLLVATRAGASGVICATTAVAAGVLAEAFYVNRLIRPVLRNDLPERSTQEPLTWRGLFRFYIPLAMTPLIGFISVPMASAAMSRMPNAVSSLAVWPVVSGLMFIFRSPGIGFNEVVVSMIDRPGAPTSLLRFTRILGAATSVALFLLWVTPLSMWWFGHVSSLSPELASLAKHTLWITILWPALGFAQSWHQGILVNARETRSVTESVVISLLVISIGLWTGVAFGKVTGLYVGLSSTLCGLSAQALWLWHRSRALRRAF
jgi:hypothetical protein